MKRGRFIPLLLLLGFCALAFSPSAGGANLEQKRTEAKRIESDIAVLDDRLEIAAEAYDGATVQLGAVQEQIEENQSQLAIAQGNLRSTSSAPPTCSTCSSIPPASTPC